MNLRSFAILTIAAALLPTVLAVDDGEKNSNNNNSIRGASSSFLSSTLSNDVTPRQKGLRQLGQCQCKPNRGKYCCENGETCTSSGCESPPPPAPGACPSCILSDYCTVCSPDQSGDWTTSNLECGDFRTEPTSVLTGYKSSSTIDGKTVTIKNSNFEKACNDGTGKYYTGGICRIGGGCLNLFDSKCCPLGEVYAGTLLGCIPLACDESVTPGECDDGGNGPITPQPTSAPTQAVVTPQPTSAPTQAVVTPQPTSAPTQAVVTPQPTSAPTQAVVTPNPTPLCAGLDGQCKGKGSLPCCSGFTCNRNKVCESLSGEDSLPWAG